MSEMVERVAFALEAADQDWEGYAVADVAFPRQPRAKELALARAAIEAMREPTEEMMAVDAPDMPAGGDVGDIWQAMVNAALAS